MCCSQDCERKKADSEPCGGRFLADISLHPAYFLREAEHSFVLNQMSEESHYAESFMKNKNG
jgi:hypothetical protein